MHRFIAATMLTLSCLGLVGTAVDNVHAPHLDDMPEATHSFASAVNPHAMWEK